MFITSADIENLHKTLTQDFEKQAFGKMIDYYMLMDDDKLVCTMPAVIVGIRHGTEGLDCPFFVDLVVATIVDGIYTLVPNLEVVSLTLEDRKTGKDLDRLTLCLAKHLPKLTELINTPTRNLKLVHSTR